MGRALARWQAPIASGIAAALLLVLIVPPLMSIAFSASDAEGQLWATLFQPNLLWRLGSSIGIAFATTVLTIAIGVPLGAILGRSSMRLAGAALFLHAVPLVLPPFISALAAFHLFGRGGWLGSAATAAWLFSPIGCILVLTLCFTPVITVLTWLGVRSTDPSGDEAARIAGGAPRALWRVVLPQAVPSITLGVIIVFSLVLVEIAVPMFLRVDVYSAAVFVRLGGFSFAPGEAAVLTLPLVVLSLLLWTAEQVSPARRVIALPAARSACIPLIESRRWRGVAAAIGLLAAVMGATPIIVVGLVAVQGDGPALLATYAGDAAMNSVLYAACVSTAVVTISVVLVAVARQCPRFIGLQDATAWLGFLLPPALFALGAVTIWNRPATNWLYSGAGIVILALAARYTVLALRVELAGNSQLSPTLLDAARTCGATYWQSLIHVQRPALRRFTIGAWLLVFIFCVRDIETTALLYPPGGDPLTVRLFTLEANGPPAVVAALSVAVALLVLLPAAVALSLLRAKK
jgi:iron(III) transport system permease protein